MALKTRGYPYIVYYGMELASLLNKWVVSGCEQNAFRLHFS